MDVRKKINIILEPNYDNLSSRIYDWFMLFVICLSIVPLLFRTSCRLFNVIDVGCCAIFIIDYVLRWMTADLRSKRKRSIAFICYPITGWAIIDLLSILPTLSLLSPSFKLLRIARLTKILRVVKFLRYYEPLQLMLRVIREESRTLLTVLVMALSYVFCTALLIYNVDGLKASL